MCVDIFVSAKFGEMNISFNCFLNKNKLLFWLLRNLAFQVKRVCGRMQKSGCRVWKIAFGYCSFMFREGHMAAPLLQVVIGSSFKEEMSIGWEVDK